MFKIYPPTPNGTAEMLKDLGNNGEPLDSEIAEDLSEIECHHICSSNCRREGCNCEHGK